MIFLYIVFLSSLSLNRGAEHFAAPGRLPMSATPQRLIQRIYLHHSDRQTPHPQNSKCLEEEGP